MWIPFSQVMGTKKYGKIHSANWQENSILPEVRDENANSNDLIYNIGMQTSNTMGNYARWKRFSLMQQIYFSLSPDFQDIDSRWELHQKVVYVDVRDETLYACSKYVVLHEKQNWYVVFVCLHAHPYCMLKITRSLL